MSTATESAVWLDDALRYAALGWRLIPLHKAEKRPHPKEWQKAATADPEVLSQWAERWPDSNLGLVLGPDSGVIDIECDSPEEEEVLLRLAGEGGIPVTCCYQSARGKHRLFKWSGDLPKLGDAVFYVGKLGFRTGGGDKGAQSALPPSVHPSGAQYQWLVSPEECDPAEIPPDMMARICAAVAEGVSDIDATVGASGRKRKPGSHWQQLAQGVPEGGTELVEGRNAAAAQMAGKMLRGLSDPHDKGAVAVQYELLVAWNERNKPPLPPADLKTTFESILRREQGKRVSRSRDEQPNESIDDPHRLARQFLEDRFTNGAGERTLVYHRGEIHSYNGISYQPVPEGDMRSRLTAFLKEQFTAENLYLLQHPELWAKEGEPPKCRKTTISQVSNTLAAIQGMTLLPSDLQAPAWVNRRDSNPSKILATKSGLLNIPRVGGGDCLLPSTANFFTLNGVDYEYNPHAQCPRWLDFLRSLWPDDEESINALQEWSGHLLLPDTSHHKIMAIIGPTRSGKGTIGRVFRGLVGESSLACPTLASLGTPFGLAPLYGKTVALIADARLSGRADAVAVVEQLLSISGDDPKDINRKYLPQLNGVRLSTRFTIFANELPSLSDASGALVNRLILLKMTRSFLGREDKTLDAKLQQELPGILNWAIAGWKRLQERGGFSQPQSGMELIADMHEIASPIASFVGELCEIDSAFSVPTGSLYQAYRSWRIRNGCEHPPSNVTFGRDLPAHLPQVKKTQPADGDGKKIKTYEGIRLKPTL